MSLDDFNVKSGSSVEPTLIETELERFMFNVLPHLLPSQALKLSNKLHQLELVPVRDDVDVVYGANYDITVEIQDLIMSVRAMQNSVRTPDGRIREGISPREMKEVITSSSSLMNLLMKSHEKLMSFDRQRALEQATVDVLQELGAEHGEEIVSRFVELMETRLEKE